MPPSSRLGRSAPRLAVLVVFAVLLAAPGAAPREQHQDEVADGVPPATDGVPPATDGVPPATEGVPPATDGVPPAAEGVPPATDGVPPAAAAATAAAGRPAGLQGGNYGGLPPFQDAVDDVAGSIVVAERSPPSSRRRLLSRNRRYVVFPKGSSIQMVAEFTVGSYVPLTTIFTTGLTWGIAWKLPTHSYELYLNKRAAGEDPDLQHRAALLDDLVVFLDKFGLHGDHSVRRTLCDLEVRRGARGAFMEELLKALLVFPGDKDKDHGNATAGCEARFPHGVSILDVRPEINNNAAK